MMRSYLKGLVLAFVVAGCAATPAHQLASSRDPAAGGDGLPPALGDALVATLEVDSEPAIYMPGEAIPVARDQAAAEPLPGRGHIAVRVKWPAWATQAIPAGTSRVSFAAKAGAFNTTVDLAPGTMRATLKNVPAGPATLSASALDVMGSVLASTSATVTVVSGAVISAKLVLSSGSPPTVTDLIPQAGGTGAQVKLIGTNFGSDSPIKETLKVYVGGLPVTGTIFRTSPSEAYFDVPAWATRSAVAIDVVSGGATRSATSAKDLYRLKALVPATASITIKVGATGSVPVTGIDVLDGTWSVPVAWTTATGADSGAHNHEVPSGHDSSPITVDQSNGWIKVTQAGDYHVMARNGDLMATASIIAVP